MTDFETRIDKLFSNADARDDRYLEMLKGNDDVITLVLRGHLIVEEVLFSVLQAHCGAPQHLEGVQFRVPQLIALARSLAKIPSASEKLWLSLKELNSLRNTLAHKLSPHDRSERLSRFVKVVLGPDRVKDMKSLDSKEAVGHAISYVLGQLSVVSVFHAAIEELVAEQLRKNAEQNTKKIKPN